MGKVNKTTYIATLPESKRIGIATKLIKAGITGEELKMAMSGRICDLEDTIKIDTEVLK